MLANNISNAEAGWFEDVNEGDLHLASTVTVVVDQASDLSEVNDDIDKMPRPQGAGYDIGADELMVTALNNHFLQSGITLFPNPNDGNFIIQFDNDIPCNIEIFSSSSEKVVILDASHLGPTHQFDMSNYPEGIYFVRINANNEVYFTKLILNRKL